jgi:hypothetical protein
MDYFSISIGFLAGTATGAAGTYFGNKYTDERKNKEQQKKWTAFMDLFGTCMRRY